jgi:hypothetical protein
MDSDILQELDAKLSNIGHDQIWKRSIGGRIIWFISPSQTENMRINEIMSDETLGIHVLSEVKRVTLAFAIVGIDDIDLREYKVFGPIYDSKTDKSIKVTKDKYLYIKMGAWGAQFMDDAFRVFSDVMSSYEKENLKEVKFENSKDPREELIELESRTTEIRLQLGMAPLVEAKELTVSPEEIEEAEEKEQEEASREQEKVESASPPFDPFKTVRRPVSAREEVAPEPVFVQPSRTQSVPSNINPSILQRASEFAEIEGLGKINVPAGVIPHIANPSNINEILDKPSSIPNTDPVIIDPVRFAKNPRFNPPGI